MSGLMQYKVAGEGMASCLSFLERSLERYKRDGRVVAKEHVKPEGAHSTQPGKPRKKRAWHKTKPMPPDVRKRLGEAYLGPECMRDIARQFKCSITTVYKVAVEELGLPPRGAGRRTDVINRRKSQ